MQVQTVTLKFPEKRRKHSNTAKHLKDRATDFFKELKVRKLSEEIYQKCLLNNQFLLSDRRVIKKGCGVGNYELGCRTVRLDIMDLFFDEDGTYCACNSDFCNTVDNLAVNIDNTACSTKAIFWMFIVFTMFILIFQ